MAERTLVATEGADLILCSSLTAANYHVAQARKIPSMGVFLQPLEPTREFSSVLTGGVRSYGAWGNRAAGATSEALLGMPFMGEVNRVRNELGLPSISYRRLRQELAESRWPAQYGFSRHLVPRPADWRPGLDVVGFWWAEPDPTWTPAPELVDFLAAGDPPVLMGFGSMAAGTGDAERLADVVVTALRAVGARGILRPAGRGSPRPPTAETTSSASARPHTAGCCRGSPPSSTTAARARRRPRSTTGYRPSRSPSSRTSRSGRTGCTARAPPPSPSRSRSSPPTAWPSPSARCSTSRPTAPTLTPSLARWPRRTAPAPSSTRSPGCERAVTNAPAAAQALEVLGLLSRHTEPMPAAAIAARLGLPRSSTYHLLGVLQEHGYVVHLPEERRYGLGVAAFELGTAYSRQAPLQRLARPILTRLVDETRHNAHLAVLHGNDVLYLVEERAPRRPSLVSDVGVRLPAQLTASGLALLAALPAAQVRALYPSRSSFVLRHGTGPTSSTQLRSLLTAVRARGYAVEHGTVTPDLGSVAAAALDHAGYPSAAFAITYEERLVDPVEEAALAEAVVAAANALSRRIGGTRMRA